MSTAHVTREQHLVLYGEPWQTYERLLRLFDERRHLRITYDRGALEIKTLSAGHEIVKYLLGRLIDTLTEELNLPVAGYGSLTIKRRKKLRGLEPDQCFWIQNEAKVRGLESYDPSRDPPPDLVVEVDVSRSSINRMRVYAALGVPEVWRYRKKVVEFHLLGENGKYTVQSNSRAIAGITSADITRFLSLRGETDANTIIRQFREWMRQRMAANWA
jgi:Uma2 family endonuclease